MITIQSIQNSETLAKCRKRIEPIDSKGLDEITVAIIGSVDSGKSSTVGTLVTGIPDDGNGLSRSIVFVHPHERKTGRTSDISYQYVKLNDNRIVTFVDLAGHEAYLKTTINGLTASLPDFAVVCISDKITKMTKEHMGLCIAMSIPFVILFTKVDVIPMDITANIITSIKTILQQSGRKLLHIREKKDINMIKFSKSNTLIPFMLTSNKSEQGLDLVKQLLSVVPKRDKHIPNGFLVEHIYNVVGHGTVLSGLSGFDISIGDTLYMGPFSKGEFIQVIIRSVHNDYRYDIKTLQAKTKGCVAINYKQKGKYILRKGMILTKEPPVNVCREFEAKVQILHHHTTIKIGYDAFINCGMLREPVKFVGLFDTSGNELQSIRSGDNVIVRMRFSRSLNYVEIGQQLAFREGQTRGVGVVTKLFL